MTYLAKINRTLYVRIRVPADLKNQFPHPEIKRSLHTTSLTEARKRLPAIVAGIQDHFHLLRANRMTKQPTITAEAVEIFRRLHPDSATHWPLHRYYSSVSRKFIDTPAEDLPEDKYRYLRKTTRNKQNPLLAEIQEKLDEGWQLDQNGEWIFVGVQRSTIAVAAAPKFQVPPTAPPEPAPPTIKLSAAKKLWIAHLTAPEDTIHFKPAKKTTLDSSTQALTRLTAWVKKDLPITDLLDLDYTGYTRFLIIDCKLAKSSAKTRLRFTKAFFKFLRDVAKVIDREPTIIYPKEHGEERLSTANLPYSNQELQLFFSYIIDNRPRQMRDRKAILDLAYLILGLLYTGFRIEEQMAFDRSTVKTANGISYFDQTNMSKGTVSAIRMIPVHSRLIELGFLTFGTKKADKFFTVNAANYRKNFDKILTKAGIKSKPREKTFHSCRATFDSKLTGKVDHTIRLMFMGHAKAGMDNTYVHQMMDEMPIYKEAIEKLVYDIDFPRLKAYLLSEIKELYP